MNWFPKCCPSPSMQNVVKLVAVIQIICSSLVLVVLGFVLVIQIIVWESCKNTEAMLGSSKSPQNSSSNDYRKQNVTFPLLGSEECQKSVGEIVGVMLVYVIVLAIMTIFLFADTELLKAANQRNIGKCRMWRTIRYVRLGFATIILVSGFYKLHMAQFRSIAGVELIVDFFCILIVQRFIQELKSEEYDDGKLSVPPITNMHTLDSYSIREEFGKKPGGKTVTFVE